MEHVFLELFCGKATMSSAFAYRGFKTLSVDIRKRKGICMPDLRADVLYLTPERIKSALADKYPGMDTSAVKFVIWASVPCTVWSYAAGKYHFDDGKPITAEAIKSIELLEATLKLIDKLSPESFYIENPRGRLRYFKTFVDWLVKRHAMTKELTYISYGAPIIKPTNIFTNDLRYKPLPMAKYGRGAKSPESFDNMTLTQRYEVPERLAHELAAHVYKSTRRFTKKVRRHLQSSLVFP